TDEYERIDEHMTAGTDFRILTDRGDALAAYSMGAIRFRRGLRGNADIPVNRHAYILRSLKHPEEVETLRRVYRGRFFVIAATAPREILVKSLAKRIADSRNESKSSGFFDKAQKLIQRDEAEGPALGQN